ncbi:HPr kinase/phosphorylase [Pseudaestuariivita atlantica]|uniref:HPr kinase/phosphorylase C-terminal domain-containing protein n=1 Tax=Pseudaestuariivita atlantica TaxID=1317121 RepID=A0A0L1JNA5_9RHOB|nr:hypothetical protein [Pseudaestuariivita atlantica]KNG93192.1 hypothetical protein ATO11_12075 [Pseudaestuariivita atlantica]
MDLAARVRDGTLHGSAVALDPGRGVLILGQSGKGKSALALALMAYGAHLVADDRVILAAKDGHVAARAPATIAGRIEARGIGILKADALPECQLRLVVDLDEEAQKRIPDAASARFHDLAIPLISAVPHAYFAAAVLHALKYPPSS